MNRVILSGRLVKEPEVRVTATEKTVCTFTLAVARPFKNGDGFYDTDFINIVAYFHCCCWFVVGSVIFHS